MLCRNPKSVPEIGLNDSPCDSYTAIRDSNKKKELFWFPPSSRTRMSGKSYRYIINEPPRRLSETDPTGHDPWATRSRSAEIQPSGSGILCGANNKKLEISTVVVFRSLVMDARGCRHCDYRGMSFGLFVDNRVDNIPVGTNAGSLRQLSLFFSRRRRL